MVTTVSSTFHGSDDAIQAIQDLLAKGYPSDAIRVTRRDGGTLQPPDPVPVRGSLMTAGFFTGGLCGSTTGAVVGLLCAGGGLQALMVGVFGMVAAGFATGLAVGALLGAAIGVMIPRVDRAGYRRTLGSDDVVVSVTDVPQRLDPAREVLSVAGEIADPHDSEPPHGHRLMAQGVRPGQEIPNLRPPHSSVGQGDEKIDYAAERPHFREEPD